jgi:hypothetical protein
MLSPKEKAKELVDKFIIHTDSDWETNDLYDAKQCALVAVNEIMKAVGWKKMKLGVNRDSYWDEVKTEIKKL